MPEDREQPEGPGAGRVQVIGIVAVSLSLIVFSVLLVYSMIELWPAAASDNPECAGQQMRFLFWKFSIPGEVRLMLIVAVAGALGAMVHALRSFYWYVGNRELVKSWVLMYLMLPFSGMVLALVFYFVLRAGFFSPQAEIKDASPFGFAALASLVGLFSQQAILKLKEIAETLLSRPPEGSDSSPQQ